MATSNLVAKVFIVRPFGNRPVLKKDKDSLATTTVQFDFDKVEQDLIRPAMNQLNLTGGTTGEVFEAGDIREDMFQQLLLADIVIADITVFNANVFYELGIRHALRDKRTILIKCPGFDDTPFDIIGYRYVSYKQDNPAGSLPDLIKSIEETMAADRKDSPVFNMLPALKEQDPEKFLAVPEEFGEEVIIATRTRMIGKLKLLSNEAKSFQWKMQANRYLGQSFYSLKAWNESRALWEEIKARNTRDLQANDRLSTVYQRLAETEMEVNPQHADELLTRSDLANEIILETYQSLTAKERGEKNIDSAKFAEVYSLKGRNAKTRWLHEWKNFEGDKREITAIKSKNLQVAYDNYESGYYANMNHYYSGINALGLLILIITLAKRYPAVWQAAHDEDDTKWEVEKLETRFAKLATVMQFSLEAEKKRLNTLGETDIWFSITDADFIFLTTTNTDRIATKYSQVLTSPEASNFAIDAAEKQLLIYRSLNVLTDNVKAALAAFPAKTETWEKVHYLLFTGHMIDKKDRPTPRFPASKETSVKQKITKKITELIKKLPEKTELVGIAGGACGADILFHEVCQELHIKTQMYLAMPREDFIVTSVAFAGSEWTSRFNNIYGNPAVKHFELSDKKELPKWLQKRRDYTVWERNNLWELNSALVNGGVNMTMVALWDGKIGDGPGGTKHMIDEVRARGGLDLVIDMNDV